MTRTLTAIVLSLGLVLGLAHAASADEAPTTTTVPAFHQCVGWNPPLAEPVGTPCPPPPAPPTTTPTGFHYCLGYAQKFPLDTPCPRPPDTSCSVPARPLECDPTYNPTPPVPDAGVGAVATTAAPPTAATAPPADPEVSPTVVERVVQHKATQRVSAAPARLPATGSSSMVVIVAGLAALLVGVVLLLAGRRGVVG